MRKYLVFAGVGLLVLSVVLLLLLTSKPKTVYVYNKSVIASNIQKPHLIDSSTLYYFSGSAFVSYNFNKAETKPLTPIYILPAIDDIKWSRQGALFKASGYVPGDDLYGIISQKKMDPNIDHWWICNFSTGVISLADDSAGGVAVEDMAWVDPSSGSFVFSTKGTGITTKLSKFGQESGEGSGGNGLYLNRSGSISQLVGPELNVTGILGAGSQAAIYVSDSSKINRVNLAGDSNNTLADDYGLGGVVSESGKSIVYLSNNLKAKSGSKSGDDDPRPLKLLSFANSSNQKIQDSFKGTAQFDSHDNLLLNYLDKDTAVLESYMPNDHSRTRYSMKEFDKNELANFLLPINLEANDFVVTNVNNRLFHYTPNEVESPTSPNYEHKIQDDIFLDGFTINYDPGSGNYTVTINKNPYRINQQKALAYIKSKGIDPYQIPIEWRINDGVDRTK
jgi:hypothetical protein